MPQHNLSGSRRGFTIIEMGLAIMAFLLLLSIVMIAVNQQRLFRRDVSRTTNMNQLSKALALYVSQEGIYPRTDGMICLDGKDEVMKELISKKLFEAGQIMQDPRWPRDPEYCYRYESSGGTYSIRYYLETDRQAAKGYHYMRP
jgi:type II secretory pathway pseudopilin PulG